MAKEPLITELIAACVTARNGLTRPADERERQVEDAFFRAAAAMETFLSEWVVRCLSFDATQFRATHESKAVNWVSAEFARWEPGGRLWSAPKTPPSFVVSLPIKKKHSLSESRRLLGAEDDNYSIRNATELVETARTCLVEKYARRPRELGGLSAAVLDATVAIRNVIAHRSDRSVQQMNSRLQNRRLPTGLQRRNRAVTASGVGYYLQADRGDGRPRFEAYLTELGNIAHVLAPTDGRRRAICPPAA